MGYTPSVLVVGGGPTATAIARDLSMRGLEVRLLAAGTLAGRTTARPVCRSGARFARTAPETATRWHAESERLRRIASHCVEPTGGVLVSLPGDGADVAATREACEAAGIPAESLDADEVQRLEPRLSSDVEAGVVVPDAAVDPFGLTVAQARSVRTYGGTVETHAEVVGVTVEDGAVRGVTVRRRGRAGTETVDADFVVDATGSRAGSLAAMAGFDLATERTRRVAVVANDRPTDAVVTRCGPGGPAVVPRGRRCVLGTADPAGEDPAAAVDAVWSRASALVPGLADTRPVRAYPERLDTGVSLDDGGEDDLPRGFRAVDHQARDGCWGFLTVFGGPLGVVRAAAEAVTDRVCAKFGIDRECLTDQHPLPGSGDEPTGQRLAERFGLDETVAARAAGRLGSRAGEVLDTGDPNPVVCACESVTRAEVRDVLDRDGVGTDLDAVRVHTGAATGECQGGRCWHRLASELHPAREPSAVERAVESLSASRWRGQRRALWGETLAGAMSTYALHAATMNRDRDLGDLDLDAFDSGPVWDEQSPGGGTP
jgi:glycerol-3-phosphate dehydrogenase